MRIFDYDTPIFIKICSIIGILANLFIIGFNSYKAYYATTDLPIWIFLNFIFGICLAICLRPIVNRWL